MILRQLLHDDPVGISYLFVCGGKAAGAVVDPAGDAERCLRAVEDAGLRIHFVIDTHVHPDHLSAGRTLTEAEGAAIVGDLGRTELAVSAEQGAKDLFRSAGRLEALPDHVEVLPGAYAGSVCGRRLSDKPWSTIGFKNRHNENFRIEDEAAFIRLMLAEVPPVPPEAAALRAANSGVAVAAA